MDISMVMKKVNSFIKDIIPRKYVGVYFHGSLRLGSFNPEKSDLDFIIVCNDILSYDEKKRICDVMMANRSLFPKKGFEFSVVLEKYCHDFVYPTPYELHMSRDYEDKYIRDESLVINDDFKTDFDLASHFNVINVACDEMDFGKSSKEVFCKVPFKYVFDSNFKDIENAREDIVNNPTYVILNLCRFYAFLKDGVTLSKYDGGLWAIDNLSWDSNIINLAMDDYMGGLSSDFGNADLYGFANRCLEDIFSLIKEKEVKVNGNLSR